MPHFKLSCRQLFLFYLILSATILLGQSNSGRISGYLTDSATGEPIMYANVVLSGTNIGTASDNHGYYVITHVPSGTHNLRIMMMGYATENKSINISANDDQRHDFELNVTVISGEDVTVTAEKQRFEEKVEISRVNLGIREIKNAPAFVEADLFRTLQLLPGVTSVNDFSSALVVRGGGTDENLILLDGIELYNPYHLGGVFSTFNANAIADAEFIAGGFPANFGNRVSSVLKITSKEGDSKKRRLFNNSGFGKYWDLSQVQGEVSLLSSKVLAEGPIKNGSWMWSYRRTYFDKLFDLYYLIKDNDDGVDWKYYFWDTQGKMIYNISNKNRLTYSTYLGRDVLFFKLDDEDDVEFDWDWGNYTNSLQWRYVPNSKFLSTMSISNTNFKFDVNLTQAEKDTAGNTQTTEFVIFNEINDWTFKEKLDWFISNNNTVTAGLEFKKLGMRIKFEIDDVNYFDQNQTPYILSFFIQDKIRLFSRLTLQPGIRVSKYKLHDKIYAEPRFGLKYLINENLAFKAAWGVYKQFLFTTNDDNAILNIVDFWQPITKHYKAKSLQQYIVGLEQWIGNGYSLGIEAYYKDYDNTLTNNPKNNPIDENDDYVEGTGRVYGVEFLFRKNLGRLTGWLGYSFSNNRQEFDFNSNGVISESAGEIFPPQSDKPHTVNIVANYALSEKNTFGLTISGSSGRPYTPTVGYTYTQNINNGFSDTFDSPYNNLANINGTRNSARYPYYLRADVSWTRTIAPFGWDGKFKFQIINVTNHFNVLLYHWDLAVGESKVQALSMFPFFPSLGVEFKF